MDEDWGALFLQSLLFQVEVEVQNNFCSGYEVYWKDGDLSEPKRKGEKMATAEFAKKIGSRGGWQILTVGIAVGVSVSICLPLSFLRERRWEGGKRWRLCLVSCPCGSGCSSCPSCSRSSEAAEALPRSGLQDYLLLCSGVSAYRWVCLSSFVQFSAVCI